MLRDCDASNVWESSFLVVNMYPGHRIGFEDWLKKISGFVEAAEKFDTEVIDVTELLPKSWLTQPLSKRQEWLSIIDNENTSWDVDLVSKLRSAGMSLHNLANIFKIYHAEKRVAASIATKRAPGTPVRAQSNTTPTPGKGSMIYHLYKPTGVSMTPEQKFQHMIKVRNRTLGPQKATTVSPYLDVHVTDDNKRFISLTADDLNMHTVMQQSTCKHGKRRKVARRALNALGGVSGIAGLLNDKTKIREIQAGLLFASSFEEMKAKEKKLKQSRALIKKKKEDDAEKARVERAAKAAAKRQETYDAVRVKLGLADNDQIIKTHVSKLSIVQLRAVAFLDCKGARLHGKVADMRQQLRDLLPGVMAYECEAPAIPEYETQDAHDGEVSETTTDGSGDLLELEELRVGEIVEVYWEGEEEWYEGEVMDIDLDDRMFEITYTCDSVRLYHRAEEYPVRYST